jgi:hypothetical protein
VIHNSLHEQKQQSHNDNNFSPSPPFDNTSETFDSTNTINDSILKEKTQTYQEIKTTNCAENNYSIQPQQNEMNMTNNHSLVILSEHSSQSTFTSTSTSTSRHHLTKTRKRKLRSKKPNSSNRLSVISTENDSNSNSKQIETRMKQTTLTLSKYTSKSTIQESDIISRLPEEIILKVLSYLSGTHNKRLFHFKVSSFSIER